MKRGTRLLTFYLIWLVLLLIPLTTLCVWMRDPYVHDTKTSLDSTRATKNTSGATETLGEVRVSNNSDGKHQAFQVALSDGIGITAILTRVSDVRQQPPEQLTDHPQDTFVGDQRPRKPRMFEIAVLLTLVFLTTAILFSVSFIVPRIGFSATIPFVNQISACLSRLV